MYYVYKITNKRNDRYYIGVHKTDNPNDGYYGSGKIIKRAIQKYGKDSFDKKILYKYNTESLAYKKEKELLSESLIDPLCYNLNEGGQGSWTYVNSTRNHRPNPMHDPDIVKKNLESRKANETEESRKKKSDQSRLNIQKAIQYNTGRKRPRQSNIMKYKSHWNNMWADKETVRDKMSTTFIVESPAGIEYTTNRLQDFCLEHNLTYVSVWNSSRTGRPVSKGKSKGWKCKTSHN